ncbi:hypothetical protein C5167_042498 [Papaver somniferum]|uniref:Uncharacterized protein n=1 Tax=Papaver somniferum TaxID=3469 RepID=A0A4Y7L5L4_PAPSO|nr:hypothetical protein C5167_042498 [Papaver somniferum]
MRPSSNRGRGGGGFRGRISGGGRGFGDGGGRGRGGRVGARGRGVGFDRGGGHGCVGMKGGNKVSVDPHRLEGVFVARAKGKEDALVTKNLVPGEVFFGEKRVLVQASILAKNAKLFLRINGHFVVSIKVKSIVSKSVMTYETEKVFANELYKLQNLEFRPTEQVNIEPYFDTDHACVVGRYRVPKVPKIVKKHESYDFRTECPIWRARQQAVQHRHTI